MLNLNIQLFAHNTGNRADTGADDHAQEKPGEAFQREENNPRRYQETGAA